MQPGDAIVAQIPSTSERLKELDNAKGVAGFLIGRRIQIGDKYLPAKQVFELYVKDKPSRLLVDRLKELRQEYHGSYNSANPVEASA